MLNNTLFTLAGQRSSLFFRRYGPGSPPSHSVSLVFLGYRKNVTNNTKRYTQASAINMSVRISCPCIVVSITYLRRFDLGVLRPSIVLVVFVVVDLWGLRLKLSVIPQSRTQRCGRNVKFSRDVRDCAPLRKLLDHVLTAVLGPYFFVWLSSRHFKSFQSMLSIQPSAKKLTRNISSII